MPIPRIIGAVCLSIALLTAPAAMAQTARRSEATINRTINATEVIQALAAKGLTSVRKESETEISVVTEDGFRFLVMLMACDVPGLPAGCLGISLTSSWSLSPGDAARLRPIVDAFNEEYRIAKVLINDQALLLERYVITDGGVSLDHVGEEVVGFLSSASLLQTAVSQAPKA